MNFNEYFEESIKKLGKLKLKKIKDPASSPRFNMFRPAGRKNPNMIPATYSPSQQQKSITSILTSLDTTEKIINIAKAAQAGIWKISKAQVLDIARKYKFNIPDSKKKSKHLGSTGIQLIRVKPGVYYLYKPRKNKLKRARGLARFHLSTPK